MAFNMGTPDTPEWWLGRLVQRLLDRMGRYDLLEAYFEGNHPLPDGDERYVKALKSLQYKSRTNVYGMATKAPVERMSVRFFKIAGEVDEDCQRIWRANNMDFQAPVVHLTAASLGNNYVRVSMPDKSNPFSPDTPLFTALDPRTCITEEDPANPQLTLAALQMWQDDVLGKIMAQLYVGGSWYQYMGPNYYDCKDLDKPGLTKKLLSGEAGGGLQMIDLGSNPYGLVPIVRADWIPSYKGISFAECEDAIDIQDRINATILDRMVISRAQAYKQRWAKGIKLPKSKYGQVKPPFDPGADMLWVTEDPDAEFGEFSEADIRQIIEAVQDDIANFAMVTKTPPHYLMGKLANVSGSTLTQAEAGLVSKTRQRSIAMGWAWERAMRLALLYMNNKKALEPDFEVVWEDPELHSRVENADAFSKEVAGGLAPIIAAERLGLRPDQLKVQAEFQAEQQAQAEKKAAQDMALQKEAINGRSKQSGTQAGSSQGTSAPGR